MGEGIQTDTICLPASGPCGLSGLLSRPDGAFAEGLTPSPEYLATVAMGGGQGPVSLADGLSEQEVLPGPLTGPRSPPVPPGQLCLDLFGGFCHYPPKPLSLLIWDQAQVEPRERSRVSPPGPLAPRVPGTACMETFEGRAAWLLPYFFFLSCTLYLGVQQHLARCFLSQSLPTGALRSAPIIRAVPRLLVSPADVSHADEV